VIVSQRAAGAHQAEEAAMRARDALVVATAGIALVTVAACGGTSGGTITGEESYEITESIDALVVDARAAAVTIETGDGPVTVTEIYRYEDDKPATSHRVDGSTLRLTDTGCRNDEVLCGVEFRVHMPAESSARIDAQAGAVRVTGLAGDVTATTQAGAFEGEALTGDQVSVTTQAGAATLAFSQAPVSVRATTQVGAIEVKVPAGTAYAVDARTNVGGAEVSVQQDQASAHKIQVSAELGSVNVSNG
jgi:hypothetical protein